MNYALIVMWCALTTDVITTFAGLLLGAKEVGPVAKYLTRFPVLLVGIRVATAILLTAFAFTVWIPIGFAALFCVLAIHNVRVIERMK